MTTTSNRGADLSADVGFAERPPKFERRTWLQSAWRELRRAPPTAWFGLIDFKVLLLEKPGGAPKPTFTENKGYRWYSQR